MNQKDEAEEMDKRNEVGKRNGTKETGEQNKMIKRKIK
jgi:hypothetical protein